MIQDGWSILGEMNEIENLEKERKRERWAETSEVSSTFRDIDTKYSWYIERNIEKKKEQKNKFQWTVFQFG